MITRAKISATSSTWIGQRIASLNGNEIGSPRAGKVMILTWSTEPTILSLPVTLAGRIAVIVEAVFLAVILRLPFVEDFVHRVLHMAVAEIVLVDDAVAIKMLLAADRERTGIGDASDPAQPRRLEAIVHAEDVELERDPRRIFAAKEIGEVDHPLGLRRDHRRHDIVELADIAAHDPHLFAKALVIGGAGVDVHADDFLAALRQQRDETAPDEAGAADHEYRHRCSSPKMAIADVSRRPPFGKAAGFHIGCGNPL